MDIRIRKPAPGELEALKVSTWPLWEKGKSRFPWSYSQTEECYLLEGKVTVTPERGKAVSFGAGDYVIFPKGLSCTWEIHEPVRKHYRFT